MPPIAIVNRLTTLFSATSPTFWLKDVFGRTPNNAAKEDPRPSQMIPPESSLSLGSRFIPPSQTPEISPTVSTAVTMNMTMIGRIAFASNTHFTGTACQFSTQLFVASTVFPAASV